MKSNADLAQRITIIWTSFPLCYFKAVYESIPKRFRAVYIAKRKLKNYQFFFLYFLDRKTLKLHYTVLHFTKKTRKSIKRAKKRPVVLRRYCTLH